MNRKLCLLCFFLFAAPLLLRGEDQPRTEKVPVIQGNGGPCSVEFTIFGVDGKPVYAATVKVHIAYGFGGMHKLDLEAGTNSDGKVRFTDLPRRVSRPPLEFRASKDDLEGRATYDPLFACQTKLEISLAKPKTQDEH